MPNTIDRSLLETQVKRWLAHFLKLVLWEPVESMDSFLKVLVPTIVTKLVPEIPGALRKGRLDDLHKRTFRWIEKSFWDDIRKHPDDALDKRTLRLKRLFDNTPQIPHRQGDSEHFPISVYNEYELLFDKLKPEFKRRPPEDHHRSRSPLVRLALFVKRIGAWDKQMLQRESSLISQFGFREGEVLNLTPRKAALRILATKMNLSEESIWNLVEEGRKLLPSQILEKMVTAYSAIETNSSWQYLNKLDPSQ